MRVISNISRFSAQSRRFKGNRPAKGTGRPVRGRVDLVNEEGCAQARPRHRRSYYGAGLSGTKARNDPRREIGNFLPHHMRENGDHSFNPGMSGKLCRATLTSMRSIAS